MHEIYLSFEKKEEEKKNSSWFSSSLTVGIMTIVLNHQEDVSQ